MTIRQQTADPFEEVANNEANADVSNNAKPADAAKPAKAVDARLLNQGRRKSDFCAEKGRHRQRQHQESP